MKSSIYPNGTIFPGSRSSFAISNLLNDSFIIFGGSGYSRTTSGDLNDIWIFIDCYCENGYCYDGENSGKCSQCFSGYYGPYCNYSTCPCVNGYCVDNNTSCQCNDNNISGEYCTDIAYNMENISINSNSSNNITNLFVNESTVFIFGQLFIIGEITVKSSTFQLNSSNLIINGSLSFNSSIFFISNSSISVDGCAVLRNTQITIDISKYIYSNKEVNITLIKSKSSCLSIEGNTTIAYIKSNSCDTTREEITSDSLILLVFIQKCDQSMALKLTLGFLIMILNLLI